MSSHPTFIWRRSNNKLRQEEVWLEYFCVASLFLAALGLFLINLGGLPLSGREAVLASIAREIYNSSLALKPWIFPTLWGEPVLNCPPSICNLIALSYSAFGVSEFTTRLPGAVLAAVSVLMLYKIGREIFIARLPALFSAGIYLTFLPVVRLGRLATFEGGLLCLEILTIWAILRARRDLRWTLISGVFLGATALSSGIQSLQILAVILIFLGWDTPRLINSGYLWLGILLGIAPTIFWYAAQWYRYHDAIAIAEFGQLLFEPINNDLGADSLVSQLAMRLEYFIPWTVVVFSGLQSVRQNLHWGWSKLTMVWASVVLLTVLLLADGQYSHILFICPPLALAGGIKLNQVFNLASYVDYPRFWGFSWGGMAILIAVAALYAKLHERVDFYSASIGVALFMTLGTVSILIFRREVQFIPLVFWGLYVSLFIFISSPHWIWERGTFEPLEPLAAKIEQQVTPGAIVYTSEPKDTSALSFYSERQVVFLEPERLKQYWRESSSAYLLLDETGVRKLNLPDSAIARPLDLKPNWFLVLKGRE